MCDPTEYCMDLSMYNMYVLYLHLALVILSSLDSTVPNVEFTLHVLCIKCSLAGSHWCGAVETPHHGNAS